MTEPRDGPGSQGDEPERQRDDREFGGAIAIGLALGAGIGLALGNIAIGIAVGLALGVAFASARRNQ